MSFRGRRWVAPQPVPVDGVESVPLPRWLRGLVKRRGWAEDGELDRYLEPSLGHLDDPALLAGMSSACDALVDAVQNGRTITVYGDYDVDGVCATSVLVEFLRSVDATVDFYIPDRRSEGYGLNVDAIREIAGRSDLMVTVDCGITAVEALSEARTLGLDVIVVDHHQVPASLPPALACLNPHRPDCAYPFKPLCAAGLAFLLAVGLRRALRDAGHFGDGEQPDVRPLLDIVALATVADMVPITGTNRVLVAAGLRRMKRNPRPGIRALMDVAGVDPREIRARDLGYRIGPRINAKGRLAHAGDAVDLMLTPDATRARHLAATLDQANGERREVEKRVQDEAIAQVEALKLADGPAIVVEHPSWHPGVLGLVASRLVSRFHRPAVVIGEGGKGSGRSIEGLDLHAAISACREHLDRFGGHPAAAGLTLRPGALPAFRDAFEAAVVEHLGPPPYVAVVEPDLEVNDEELSLRMVQELSLLEPFGQENPEPLLMARRMRVREKRVVGGEHLKLSLGESGHDAIGFGLGAHADQVPDEVDVV
ncbi:MAG: single-stranded-DNA-specific exonuclease RecJ, partial [Myxococcota bacterium]